MTLERVKFKCLQWWCLHWHPAHCVNGNTPHERLFPARSFRIKCFSSSIKHFLLLSKNPIKRPKLTCLSISQDCLTSWLWCTHSTNKREIWFCFQIQPFNQNSKVLNYLYYNQFLTSRPLSLSVELPIHIFLCGQFVFSLKVKTQREKVTESANRTRGGSDSCLFRVKHISLSSCRVMVFLQITRCLTETCRGPLQSVLIKKEANKNAQSLKGLRSDLNPSDTVKSPLLIALYRLQCTSQRPEVTGHICLFRGGHRVVQTKEIHPLRSSTESSKYKACWRVNYFRNQKNRIITAIIIIIILNVYIGLK